MHSLDSGMYRLGNWFVCASMKCFQQSSVRYIWLEVHKWTMSDSERDERQLVRSNPQMQVGNQMQRMMQSARPPSNIADGEYVKY